MKRYITSMACAGVGMFLVGCQAESPRNPVGVSPGFNVAAGQAPGAHHQFAEQFIVSYGGARMPAEAADLIGQLGGSIARDWEGISFAVVTGITDEDAAALRNAPGVISVSRDVIIQWIPDVEHQVLDTELPQVESHDPAEALLFDRLQWNMRQIQADDAWAAGFEAAPDVLAAILDTGVNPTHVDMVGRVNAALSRVFLNFTFTPCDGTFFPDDRATFDDFNLHGTHVGGLVTTNGVRTAGVAPHATLVAVKVLNCFGFGSFADIIDGILYAASIPVDVINMSLGAFIFEEFKEVFRFEFGEFRFRDRVEFDADVLVEALDAATNAARDADVFVVASAGNNAFDLRNNETRLEFRFEDGDFKLRDKIRFTQIAVPAQSDRVAAISATGPVNQMDFDRLASYSNFGRGVISVAAPGGDFVGSPFDVRDLIFSPCSRSTIFISACRARDLALGLAGTSMAAPHVTGTALLVDAQFGGALDGDELRRIIEATADDLGNRAAHGNGRLNVFNAVLEVAAAAGGSN